MTPVLCIPGALACFVEMSGFIESASVAHIVSSVLTADAGMISIVWNPACPKVRRDARQLRA
jgi:hypothetical protein